MAMENQQKRHIAYKVRIKDILNNEFVKGEGWDPSFLNTPSGVKIARINLISTVIDKSSNIGGSGVRFTLDDGSDQISCMSFERNERIDSISIGDVILIIGRPRSFGNELYIMPEIMKKIESGWLLLRSRELQLFFDYRTPEYVEKRGRIGESSEVKEVPTIKEDVIEIKEEEISSEEEVKNIKEETEEKKDDSMIFSPTKMIDLIREMDKGNGVGYEEVVAMSNTSDGEQIINMLLKEGEIFEISPGRLKVLE